MSREVPAGKASVIIEANRSRLAAGLRAAQKELVTFAAGAAKIGAGMGAGAIGVLAPVAAAVRSFADAGGAIDDIAQRTGASAEAISSLGYAAKMSGSSIEDIEKGIRSMQKGIASGSKVLEELGLDPATLSAMSPDQQFAAIADKIAAIEDPAARVTAAMEIFGKSGANLLPLLSTGSKGIDALRSEARSLGAEMSGEDAAAAATLGDSIDMLGTSFSGLVNTIGATVAPMFTAVLQAMTHAVSAARTYIAENQGVVIAAVLGAVSLGTLGAALTLAAGLSYGLSVAVGVVTATVGGAVTVMTGLVSVVKTVSTTVAVATTAVKAFRLATLGAAAASTVMRAVQLASAAATKVVTLVMGAGKAASAAWAAVTGVLSGAMATLKSVTLASMASSVAMSVSTGLVTAAKSALSVVVGVLTGSLAGATAAAGIFQAVLTGGIVVAIAAVVGGLIGLAGYLAYTSGAGGKAMDWLSGKFQMLQDIVGPVFQGIQDAMSGGNFQLAAEILWLGVQVAWMKGTADLRAAWDNWLNGMLGAIDNFIVQFRQKWNNVSGYLADVMLDTYGYFDETFDAEQAKQMRAEDTARQNQSFAAGGANRAAGRDAAAEANMREREAAIAKLEAALSDSTAKAAAAAAEAADNAADESLADTEEIAKPESPSGTQAAQADNQLGKASDSMRGTFSGFAAALMGQSGAYDLDAEMLAESKAQTQYLAEMAGALVATAGTQVMLNESTRDPFTQPGAKGPTVVAQLDPALTSSLTTANTTLSSILARLKEMEGGFA